MEYGPPSALEVTAMMVLMRHISILLPYEAEEEKVSDVEVPGKDGHTTTWI
jgi:hypothetical protein